MKKIRKYAINSKNRIGVLIFISFLFSSCEKSPNDIPITPDPPVSEKLVQWKWETKIPEWKGELQRDPILYKDLIITGFASDYQNRNIPLLVAFDKRTGEKKWEYTYPFDKTENCYNIKNYENFLIITFSERIVCLNLLDRSIVWERVLTENHSLAYPFMIYQENAYIVEHYYDNPSDFPFNDSVSLVKYQIPTGQSEIVYGEQMAVNSTRHPQYCPNAFLSRGDNNYVLFTREFLDPGEIGPVDFLCIDINKKEVNWINQKFSPFRTAWNTPPIIFNNNVIVASDYKFYCYDANNGSLMWETELTGLNQKAGFSFSGPFLDNGKIYAVSNEGKIFCVDATSGYILWQNVRVGVEDNGPARGPCLRPIVVDDILFINAWSDQALVLIDAKTGVELERHKLYAFNGRNVLYDEETKTFFVTADDQIRAFTIKK